MQRRTFFQYLAALRMRNNVAQPHAGAQGRSHAVLVIGVFSLVLAMSPIVQASPGHNSPNKAVAKLPTASGSDASCPAISESAASSHTVTSPTLVRAIPGARQVTVVWCPPSSGAGSVISYTVKSSSGQKVTAAVPNDWAIIGGLSNGTSYTFTVRANTTSGPTSDAARSKPVTPHAILPPGNVLRGKSQQVTYDSHSMIINGKRVFITAGEFDPWRTPSPSLWLDRLEKMKADGYNAVTVYFDWDFHSPSPGVYKFDGLRNVNQFLNMAQQVGLYVIARPGPYINAETDGGGIPTWVLTIHHGDIMPYYRDDTEPYLSAALQWISEIDPVIAAHQITRGGDVILYQIENEYGGQGKPADQYMADLEHQARADGIHVPFTFNQTGRSQAFATGLGAVNISGTDHYPVGFNCDLVHRFGNPHAYPRYKGMPVFLPEFQGGSFDHWGGPGYADCYQLTGPDFENVYYKNNIAQGATMQSNYMGVGGTNWGWLPSPGLYTSYDYGAAIAETGEIGTPAHPNSIVGSKFGENKLINNFETSVAPLTDTSSEPAPTSSNPAIKIIARQNPQTNTQFLYLRQANGPSTATVSTHLALTVGGVQYPVVPQSGNLTLKGRDAKMLLAGYHFDGQSLVYSTSELASQESIGSRAVALLYGPAGTDGETVLQYKSLPTVKVISGAVTTKWDAIHRNLRLDYRHHGLAEVAISGGGRPQLLLLLAGTNTAEQFWPLQTQSGPVLVEGGYLVRTASSAGKSLALTGDTSRPGRLTVWAPPSIQAVQWNHHALAVTRGKDGALQGTLPGPAPVHLPALTNWRFKTGAPESQPGFDDRSWTLADHPTSTDHTVENLGSPVLDATDYGYGHGFVWYRGHFTANQNQTGLSLTVDGEGGTGAYSVWLNGVFLGSANAVRVQTHTFNFPKAALHTGKDNVIAVLVENVGNPEGPRGYRAGVYSASLIGGNQPIVWKMMGVKGGTVLQDQVRGIMNAAGLCGSNHDWNLPGYPDKSWKPVTLPDKWSARGVPPGIGWYRTHFSLHLPENAYVPVDLQIGNPGPGKGVANYQALIYINGWFIGRYVNNVGPQHRFYLPAGILNEHGRNTLAIAVWGLTQPGGGLAKVTLVAVGNQAGGVPITPVNSPIYNGASN
jgi:beta-galactosidase